jgi:hypothetical protein
MAASSSPHPRQLWLIATDFPAPGATTTVDSAKHLSRWGVVEQAAGKNLRFACRVGAIEVAVGYVEGCSLESNCREGILLRPWTLV